MSAALRLGLVGPDHQENLAIGYLAAAAEQAGHEVRCVSFAQRRDAPRAVGNLLTFDPEVVGLSLCFQYSVGDCLDLITLLRDRGYAGHITCGGHVPTFCYRELLRDCPGLDTAVRHEGEHTLSELLQRLARGEPARDIPGLVWREGEAIVSGPTRPLIEDLDGLPRPKRPPLVTALAGVPVAFMLTSRGCIGDCAYCCVRAFQRDAGGPVLRLRSMAAVAEEVLALRRVHGARAVVVQDDLFVLGSEQQTIRRAGELSAALRSRGVDDMVFWVKGRPEHITAKVVRALSDMGTIHLFVGIESDSAERLSYLGRGHGPEHNASALRLIQEHGLFSSFNLMLFDPDCTLRDLHLSIDFAERSIGVPWNVCRTEIYAGTPLLQRLQKEHRLEGDYRGWAYRMLDPRAELCFRILRVSLHHRAFSWDSLLNRLISLSFARQVHERARGSKAPAALLAAVDELLAVVEGDTVAMLRDAVAFAAGADLQDHPGARRFAVEQSMACHERDHRFRRQATGLWRQLEAHPLGG